MDVAQQPVEAVPCRRAARSRSISTLRPGRREPLELAVRLAREALALAELGRVDLDQSNACATAQVERVAVADTRDDVAVVRSAGVPASSAQPGAHDRDEERRATTSAGR